MSEAPTRVVIAGAGPVGLALAQLLAQAGVPVVVLEANPDLAEDLRASTFHPPTLDMLAGLGVAEGLIALGVVAPVWQVRERRGGLVAEFDLSLLKDDTAHPYRLQCEQYKLARLIKQRLDVLPGAEIRFSSRLAELAQHGDGVDAVVEDVGSGERYSLRAGWLVGCDGTGSQVRQSLGIAYEGFTYPERFFSISTPFDFAAHIRGLSYVSYFADPEEWCFLLRVPGLWRVMFPIPEAEPDAVTASAERVEGRLQGVLTVPEPYPVVHRTLYRVQQRIAETYRQGRVLLAGDAAHNNNPLGGMGLNSGLHDAFNLAEKLIAVLRGEAEEELLERYVRQRRWVSLEHVNQMAARNKALLEARDPEVRRRGLDDLKRTAADPEKAYRYLLNSSLISSLRRAAEL